MSLPGVWHEQGVTCVISRCIVREGCRAHCVRVRFRMYVCTHTRTNTHTHTHTHIDATAFGPTSVSYGRVQ